MHLRMNEATRTLASILFLLALSTSYTAVFSQTMSVSSPISIPSAYGNYHPQITMTNDAVPAVIWTSSTLKNLYFAKHDGGSDFNTPIQLNPPGFLVQSYTWSGPDLAKWQDNLYVVFKAIGYSTGHIYVVKSTDSGETFGDTVRVDDLADGFPQYPDIAVFNDTIFVTFMDHDAAGLNPQYVVTRSVDGGVTFASNVDAGTLLGDEACDCCQPEIIVNDKYVIVYFRNNASNIRDTKAVISFDRGATFSNIISVDDHLWNTFSCPSTGPDALFSALDTVISGYKSEVLGEAKIFLNEYDLAADSTLRTIELSIGTGSSPNYPQLSYSNGNLGAVWEGQDGDPEVFFNWSSTGVQGLSPANTINVTNAPGAQTKPDICYGNGEFHVVWAEGGSSGIKYVTISEALSVNLQEDLPAINILPNPVISDLRLRIESGAAELLTAAIFDSKGAHVCTWAIPKSTNAQINFDKDLSALKSGLYFLNITDGNGSTSQKFIKL